MIFGDGDGFIRPQPFGNFGFGQLVFRIDGRPNVRHPTQATFVAFVAQLTQPVGDLDLGLESGSDVNQMHFGPGHVGHYFRDPHTHRRGLKLFIPFGFAVDGHGVGRVDQAFQHDVFGFEHGRGAKQVGSQCVFQIDGLRAIQVGLTFFLAAVGPQCAQKQVGFEAIGDFIQDKLARIGSLDDLIVAPVGFGQCEPQIDPVIVFCEQRA